MAVSTFYIPQIICSLPANFNFTSGSPHAHARQPVIMIAPVKSAAARAQTKGATWKPVQDVVFSGVRA
jgi:hypothetical protein